MKLRTCFVLPVKVRILENKYFFPTVFSCELFLKAPRSDNPEGKWFKLAF